MARLRLGRDGVTAIEVALLLPVFLAFMLGIVEAGRALWTQTALQFAVEAAARCAAVSPTLCTAPGGSTEDVPAYAASQAFGLSIPKIKFVYTPNTTPCTGSAIGGTAGSKVTVTYPFESVVPKLVPLNVTLSACSYHP